MARGPIYIWNEWATQILVLLSFALQIFLFVFARTRRCGSSPLLRFLLWLVYLMADSTAIYTLGHLSINGILHEHELVVFWAPFLVVHLGSQDTITAYALEDNQLWPRHLLNLGVQAFGVAYILYKHIGHISTSLGLATCLMFVIGLIKYGERIWALKCATMDDIRSSIKKCGLLPTYYGDLLPPSGASAEERDEEELLLFAQAMLPLCKGGIINFPVVLISHPHNSPSNLSWCWNWNWKATFKVVEMELSLMYDILYTKAAIIHSWYGYCIRVFLPFGTVAAFVMFQVSGDKDGCSRIDVAITYILLVGAFLLDMSSMLSALVSTWTCGFFWTRNWRRLGCVVMSLRRYVKAATGNRGWSGSIGQFNLMHFCSRDKSKLSIRVSKMVRLEDLWNKRHYSKTLVISEDVEELVFKHVWQLVKKIQHPRAEDVEEPKAMMPSISERLGFRPELYDDTARRRKKFDDALCLSDELQEVILTWHVFTNVFILCSVAPKDASLFAYLKAVKALSDYMVFLIVVRPDTIPGIELRSLYEATRDALEEIWRTNTYAIKEKNLASILQNSKHGDLGKASVIISHGTLYAKLLMDLVDTSNHDKSGVISSYEDIDHVAMGKLKHLMPDLESSCKVGVVFDMAKALALILDTWVRLLVLASVRSSGDAHARQINRGGELTTVVWLMEEHASVFFNPPTAAGYERYRSEGRFQWYRCSDICRLKRSNGDMEH
ncbi:uncharacterized protein LOC119306760 [Triticum dicoccoides]|uniref:uncharacterized protein LOC119306760 n=1 Tax=Triticum dicoccoides TaxID=85692 RepID=UPI001890A365|nr:uncharacterized protein LOC119306760 [Triticum dicoccoides]